MTDEFDLAAAALRLDGADVGATVEVLASKLQEALPGRVQVRRSGGGLLGRGERRVRELVVELGGWSWVLVLEGQSLQCARGREVGGISIKREELPAASWLEQLTGVLRDEAQRSGEARAALERLLG